MTATRSPAATVHVSTTGVWPSNAVAYAGKARTKLLHDGPAFGASPVEVTEFVVGKVKGTSCVPKLQQAEARRQC